jgi:hypothetical protein
MQRPVALCDVTQRVYQVVKKALIAPVISLSFYRRIIATMITDNQMAVE